MSEELNNVIPQNYAEAESLINNLYAEAKTEKPWSMSAPDDVDNGGEDNIEEKLAAPKAKSASPKKAVDEPFEIEVDGQKFKWGKDEITKYAQSGYKAEQRYQEILTEREKISKERAEFEGKRGQYDHLNQLDNWAKENPELYNRISLEHENMKNGGEFGDVPPYLAKFVSDLEQIKGRFSEIDNFTNTQKIKAQDSQLDKEINEFKQGFPQFDWNDKSLETKILQHATKNNLSSFRAAARDLLFDDLLKRGELKAKESIGKSIQKDSKAGIIPAKSAAPQVNQNRQPQNQAKVSWDQLARKAVREFNIN